MKNSLFEKFEEKKILEESAEKILGGGNTYPGNDSSGASGDNQSTGPSIDCADDVTTDVFKDAVFTSKNNDGQEPIIVTPFPDRPIFEPVFKV